MEKRINQKITIYIKDQKDNFIEQIKNVNLNDEDKYRLMEFVYNYEHLVLEKTDFQKRKRVKNIVPFCDRCKGKRSNGEQCSRRKKNEAEFCGTHIKGIPHGKIDDTEEKNVDIKKRISVWAEEIMGITYYIDESNNVYSPNDILNNIENPNVIAKWEKVGDAYNIPSLFKY
tara:strand:- start:4616 stop:5131 length:516 start_codon:yes stop_codon:yes gene_type:complete